MGWGLTLDIRGILRNVEELERKLMAAIDDLNTSVAANTAATQALTAAVAALPASTNNDAAIEAAVTTLNANNDAVTAATNTLTALATPPAPTT